MKMVSILIRTCGRPYILKETLESVRKQTYKNIQVIIVEDGENISQQMIEEEFSDMNIKYSFTGGKSGRTVVGNKAIEEADGEYLNFLDDDDLLLPMHVETLVELLNSTKCRAAYAVAYESVVKYNNKTKKYEEKKRRIRYRQPFNRVFLSFNNYIPIQTIMFEKSLFYELGGLDESLELLEDWDLWVRYSTVTDFAFLDEVTSIYRVPNNNFKRDIDMRKVYKNVVSKFESYDFYTDMKKINEDLEYVLDVIKTPKWKQKLKKLRDKRYKINM